MSKWIVRRDTSGNPVGMPRFCLSERPIVREPGVLTIEEHLALMLDKGETTEGSETQRTVKRGESVIGFIEIVDADAGRPPPTERPI